MKRKYLGNTILILGVCSVLIHSSCQTKMNQQELTPGLKEAFINKFLIGTAINTPQTTGVDTMGASLIKKHFNSVVAENCMKCEVIHPKEDEYDFTLSDQFVDFAEANNMKAIGHTLIWHSQLADWFCVDDNGNEVSKEVLTERMKQHIHNIVGRYKGRMHGWDVVNEAFEDDGSFRESKFYQIIGEEYIKLAFQFAHEADPDAELYYNDYSMFHSGRRQGVVKMVQKLQSEGIKIDGIGMQSHYGLAYPAMEEMETSILDFSALGVDVMITELDLTVLPSPFEQNGADVANRFEYKESMDPYKAGLPDSVAQAFNKRYIDFFKLFVKHQDKISRVTLWGVIDADSWKNNWPIKGRTDFPLLFDRDYKAKPVVEDIIKLVKE